MYAIIGTGIEATADGIEEAMAILAQHIVDMEAAGGYSNATLYLLEDVATRLDGTPYIPAGVHVAPYDPSDIGGEIKRRRERAGMTQAELAEASGIAQGRLSEYERGARDPSLGALRKLAKVLGPFEVL